MRWFKHYSDNYRGRSIQDLLDQLGHTGLCYFLLVEMCAEKLEKDEQGLTEADCLFSFHTRIIRQNLRISPTNLRRLLDVCAANGLLSFELSGNSLQIKMPILLNLLERNTKKAQQTRIESARNTHLDKDKDKDVDKEEEKDIDIQPRSPKAKLSASEVEDNRLIFNAYRNAYFNRYKVEVKKHQKINGQVSTLRKQLGVKEAIEVINFFLSHNESFYLKKTHDFGLCLQDATTLRTQMLRNQPVTSTMVRQFEKSNSSQETLSQLEKMYGGDDVK